MTDKPIIYYKKDCLNEPYCSLGKVIEQLHHYKQVVKEIKEIAEENIRIADLEGLNGVYRRGLAEQILQKISEVMEDE